MSEIAKIGKHVTLFDDDAREDAHNLKGVKSEVLKEPIAAMNYAACRYRPIYNFWGVDGTVSTFRNTLSVLRTQWVNNSPGAPGLGSKCLIVPTDDSTSTTRYVTFNISSGFVGGNADDSDVSYVPRVTTLGQAYPNNCISIDGLAGHQSYADDQVYEATIGTLFEQGPMLFSGMLYEKMNFEPRYISPTVGEGNTPEHHQAMPTDWIGPGLPIIGTEQSGELVGDIRSLSQVRDFFRRVYKAKRIHFAWNRAGADDTHGLVIDAASNPGEYRYIFDESIGQGSGGTAPTSTGPGINIPVRYTASGRNTTQRIYFSIYAKMTGSSGVGTVAIYNSASSSTMQGPTAVTNGPSISGTTMQWYPGFGSVFDPDTHPYFLANCSSSLVYDHILPCVAGSGSSDVVVGAIVMFSYHPG